MDEHIAHKYGIHDLRTVNIVRHIKKHCSLALGHLCAFQFQSARDELKATITLIDALSNALDGEGRADET